MAGILFVLTLLIAGGCDLPSAPDELAEIRGTYNLVMFEGYPLPYHSHQTQVRMSSETLSLHLGGRYVRTRRDLSGEEVTGGTYRVSDRITLVSDYGEVESYLTGGSSGLGEGTLISGGTVYVKEGTQTPVRYQYERFEVVSCDGMSVGYTQPCRGYVTGSMLWLLGDGRYFVKDRLVELSSERFGVYHRTGSDITLDHLSEGRETGTLRGDTLTLGTWVYVRAD